MKMTNQTHGKLTLSKIEVYPRKSQETTAFDAVVTIDGLVGTASNEGWGGMTMIQPREVREAVEAYAKTLPNFVSGSYSCPYSADLLVATMLDNAGRAQRHSKYVKKGFRFYAEHGASGMYFQTAPTKEDLVKHFGSPDVSVLALA